MYVVTQSMIIIILSVEAFSTPDTMLYCMFNLHNIPIRLSYHPHSTEEDTEVKIQEILYVAEYM